MIPKRSSKHRQSKPAAGSLAGVGVLASLICATVLVSTGCVGRNESGLSEKEAALTYGYGPDPKGSAVYQPGVVMIHGGPRAIRSASANGLTWTIDGKAGGALDLVPGKIMFATSRAVGRVVKIERRGEDLAVTLAPVGLTEVVRDARIKGDVKITPESVVYQYVPDLPGIVSGPETAGRRSARIGYPVSAASVGPPLLRDNSFAPGAWMPPASGEGGGRTSEVPTLFRYIDYARAPGPKLPIASKTSVKVSLGDWEVEPSLTLKNPGGESTGTLRLKVQRKFEGQKFGPKDVEGTSGPESSNSIGLKFGMDVALLVENLQVSYYLPISGGRTGGARFIIQGIKGLNISLWGGAENGQENNQKIRLEVPVELNFPIPPEATGGVPIIGQIKFKFLVETAFAGKNATLEASGQYGLTGPIGFASTTVFSPVFTVIDPMMNHVQGISLGGAGAVIAVETRFLVGLGLPAAMAGAYGKLTTAVGVANGSILGFGLGLPCRGLTLKISAGLGVGVQISSSASALLEKILGKKTKVDAEIGEISESVVDRKVVWPDTPLCGGGNTH